MKAVSSLALRALLASVAAGGLWIGVWVGARKAPVSLASAESIAAPIQGQVDAIAIQRNNETATLRRAQDWRLSTKDGERLADNAAVAELLARFSALRLRPVASPGPDDLYGLDQPEHILTLTARGQIVAELAIGAPAITESAYYVRRKPLPGVFLVSALELLPLRRDAESLRERRLLPCPEEEIAAIEFARFSLDSFTEESLGVLRREGDGYLLEQQGVLYPADPTRARDLIAALANTRPAPPSVAAPAPPAPKDATARTLRARCPRYQVELRDFPFSIGGDLQDIARDLRDDQGNRERAVLTLDGSARAALQLDPASLRDTRLLPLLDRAPVARIKLRWGESFAILNRPLEGGWELLAPKPGPVSYARVEALLGALGLLRGEQVVLSSDGEGFGLRAPHGEIEFFDEAGTRLGRLTLSQSLAGGGAYAQSVEGGPVVALSLDELASLDLPAWAQRPSE